MERINIALVDDHTLFRSGLCGLLSHHEGYSVTADVGSGEEFLAALPALDVDVVFMDISMPGIDGGETARRALAVRPDLRIIALSMYGEEQYYTRMLECGASGFLLKDSDIAEVIAAVDTVYAGGSYFSRTLLDSLTSRMRSTGSGDDEGDEETLSTREIEILVCVCQGLSNQEIADKLFISKRTVDKHRANILEKTGCRNTASLVVYAIKNSLVEI
ncbi:MAG: response regulator transcription factor [Alistipes sp.]|nr:response regulator transcription factor [Alistipes sp.]